MQSLILSLLISLQVFAADVPKTTDSKDASVPELMIEIRNRIKRFKWDNSVFSHTDWKQQGITVYGRPLIYWTCGDSKNQNTTLVLSAVHGDEVTPVYFGFRLIEWIKARPEVCKDSFIVVAPIVNPDGFLRYTNGTRTNYNKVDLNRNFNTPDWDKDALKNWKTKYNSQQRYFPGHQPETEPETRFQKWLIAEFKPTKILSVHAPLDSLDYDGPNDVTKFDKEYVDSANALRKTLSEDTSSGMKLSSFGTYPGSLGNYAGKILGIPTLTIELPTANSQLAGAYFGMLESSFKNFLQYNLKIAPKITQQ